MSEVSAEKLTKVERFFDQVWNPLIFKSRYVIVALTLAWAVFATIMASKMGP